MVEAAIFKALENYKSKYAWDKSLTLLPTSGLCKVSPSISTLDYVAEFVAISKGGRAENERF
jgi:hypothetical protein